MTEAHAQEVNMRGHNSTAKTYMNEQIRPILVALIIVTTLVATSAGAAGASRRLRPDPGPTNVALSHRLGTQAVRTGAPNPTTPPPILILPTPTHPPTALSQPAHP